MNKIFGFELKSDVINVNDKFDVMWGDNDDFIFYESKETFHHKEEGLTFDYKYVIVGEYCEGKMHYTLYLVPCANSLGEEKRKSVAACSGIGVEDIETYDIWSYGCNILMGSESEEGETFNNEYFDLIASVFEIVDSMRGFFLDRYVNRIGNNDWDMLNDFVNDVPFLSRLKVC